jgi:hypothetical protein
MPTCPKCLGTHEVRPDRPPCNASSLWDNSAPAHCTRDQQGRLLNKGGRVLCWDFQRPVDARVEVTTTSAQAVEMPITEPTSAPSVSALLARLLSKALTPYNADGWRDLLIEFDLLHKHPTLLEQLMHGFHVRAPTITRSFTPLNNPPFLYIAMLSTKYCTKNLRNNGT